jgi:crotonobetainyl-CoA:carnitine CoA-transferase CaiB-like acyl-CoA transferase
MTTTEALAGLRVMTYSPGISLVGAGIASRLPGSFFRDFGAEVVQADSNGSSTLDAGVEWHRPWDRGKRTVRVGDDTASTSLGQMATNADILVLSGSEDLIEGAGLTYQGLKEINPRLVVVRIRPSRDGIGVIPDLELLIHARSGLLTQFRGHTSGPTFCTLPIAGIGAGLAATAGALARLYERERPA